MFCPWENVPVEAVRLFWRSKTAAVIGVTSLDVLFAVLVSPPPLTTDVKVAEAGALAAIATWRVIVPAKRGPLKLALFVQVTVESVHVHPIPESDVAVKDGGRLVITLSGLVVAPNPILLTWTVYVAD